MRGRAGVFAGLLITLALAAFDQWMFVSWFNTPYPNWYLKHGSLIGLATSIAAITWGDVSKHTGLISTHPLIYLGACLQFVGMPIAVLGSNLRGDKKNPQPRRPFFETLFTMFLSVMLSAALFAWLIVVAPLQYFVNLVCGAPARFSAQSTRRVIARLKDEKLELSEIGKNDKVPDGWWDASISSKPVAFTGLTASVLFLVLDAIL